MPRRISRDIEQPATDGDFRADPFSLLCEQQEDGLRDVLGQVRIVDHSPGDGIDPIRMSPDELRESRLGVSGCVFFKQLGIGHVGDQFYVVIPDGWERGKLDGILGCSRQKRA